MKILLEKRKKCDWIWSVPNSTITALRNRMPQSQAFPFQLLKKKND